MKSLLYLLLSFSCVRSISISNNCPKLCECELQADATTAVYCNRGGINDTNFYRILETAPTQISLLEIVGPEHRPNNFRWNDNLNRFGQLRALRLVNCGIPALSQSMHIKSLKQLDLSHNEIDSIQINSFKGLNALELLRLSNNRITSLPSGAFIYLKRLKHLAISYNNFSELPSSFLRGPTNLEALELDGNPLDQTGQINNLFNDVPDLKRLELNFCSLDDQKVAQLQLEKVSSVRRLGLGGNNLTEVPSSSFRALAHLETIDLRHNKIRRIQPCAFCSCNITSVLLGHNLLGVNPKSINTEAFSEVEIKVVDLSYNFFDEFESRLLGYAEASVETLDLSGNALPALKPVYTLTLPNLKHLHVADNKLGELPLFLAARI
ncbi:hypothetical protein M3Y97_00399200 [Aphelenchoides bicaudatus]|nr:hypothetical protein M3Y97_00399200 [Aphelenchoides bicaudatus]